MVQRFRHPNGHTKLTSLKVDHRVASLFVKFYPRTRIAIFMASRMDNTKYEYKDRMILGVDEHWPFDPSGKISIYL